MDDLQRNILSLEREIGTSQVNPWKVFAGSMAAVALMGVIIVLLFQPSWLKNDEEELSFPKASQFMVALFILTISLLWIFWNFYMFI